MDLEKDYWGRGNGGVKSTGVSQSVRETSRDESQSIPSPRNSLFAFAFAAVSLRPRCTQMLTMPWIFSYLVVHPEGPGEASWCREAKIAARQFGTGKRGHYERGLFVRGISRISKISKFSRISRKWLDSPFFSTVWGFSRISRISRISKFSRISRKSTFLKRPLFQKTPFSEPEQFLPLSCRAITFSTGTILKEEKCPLLWGRGNLGGILRDNLGEGNWESKIAARQWGVNFCREASRCLARPSGKAKIKFGERLRGNTISFEKF